MRTTAQLEVEGRKIPVSNLEKVLYPETGFTKGDLIHYYIAVAPFVLPHLKGRALTLKRYPNGVSQPFFYEKTCPPHHPP
ncbi:MAG TPA: ATP-dependent DNA ligase, partial [Chthoniobacteraceae bacterium]